MPVDMELKKHIDFWGRINKKSQPHLFHSKEDLALYKAFKEYREGLCDYTLEQMKKYITTWDEYKEWVYKYKIESMCEPPFCWYIKTGEFIADEMRGQVIGLYRDKSETGWGEWQEMDKYDWRYMDEDNLHTYKGAIKSIMDMRGQQWDAEPEREYTIINLEELECHETARVVKHCMSCGSDTYELKHDTYCESCSIELAESFMEDEEDIPEDIDEYICERMEIEAERLSDILRGK
jgi:hypothetical protein